MVTTNSKHAATRTVLVLAAVGAAWALVACAHAPAPSLYDQLGGQTRIETISSDLITRVAHDPRTADKFDGIRLSWLSHSLANYICKIADGPCVYDGDSMKTTHAYLHIQGSQFEVMVQALRDELDAQGISTSAKNELLRRLAPTYRDVVNPPDPAASGASDASGT
jgi:hemoglobin